MTIGSIFRKRPGNIINESESHEKWIRNIFEIMNGHLERKRFVSCFIESGKVFINQNAGKFLISEEFDQEGFRAALT